MDPLVLSLDTATPTLSCALLRREGAGLRVLGTREAGPPQVVSTLVPGLFDELLAQAGARADDVRAVVSGLGPGLFTGVRVALATMKAVSYARALPLLGAGSLESMAVAAARGGPARAGDLLADPPDSGLLCAALDARKGEVYFALYRVRGGLPVEVIAPQAGNPAALADVLRGAAEPVTVFGTGATAAGSTLRDLLNVTIAPAPVFPGAAEIAALALRRQPSPVYDAVGVLALEPNYLRPPEAEKARRKQPPGAS